MSKRTKKNLVICLIDKSWPPQHSFVNGMLANTLANEENIRVRLLVSNSSRIISPTRYGRAVCIPSLYPRRGLNRFLNLFKVLQLLYYQIRRESFKGFNIILFVRNDPIYLMSASLLRKKVSRLVFQSSFPHEEQSRNFIKKIIAKFIYRVSGYGVDSVTGVSPQGVKRIKKLFNQDLLGKYIPLLSDLPIYPKINEKRSSSKKIPTFVYLGSHSKERELQTIFKAIEISVLNGVDAEFLFIGYDFKEDSYLKKLPQVKKLLKHGKLRIEAAISRDKVPKVLSNCDIGICLIPPKPIYLESSPTKLVEYMGAGLAVLASTGIPMQEAFIKEANGGILVDWDITSISKGIQKLVSEPNLRLKLGNNSKTYTEEKLQYKQYLKTMLQLLSLYK